MLFYRVQIRPAIFRERKDAEAFLRNNENAIGDVEEIDVSPVQPSPDSRFPVLEAHIETLKKAASK